MSAKGWITTILIVAGLALIFILTAHFEGWTDSDLGDLWFVGFALAVVGVIVWYFKSDPHNMRGGGRPRDKGDK